MLRLQKLPERILQDWNNLDRNIIRDREAKYDGTKLATSLGFATEKQARNFIN
jgi:hypothetical protein